MPLIQELRITPAVRRFLDSGFTHNPFKDAPKFGFVCLESPNQRLYVNPETGDMRVGRTIAA